MIKVLNAIIRVIFNTENIHFESKIRFIVGKKDTTDELKDI